MKTVRYVWFYEDESGERFRQLFLDAEVKREEKRKSRKRALRIIGFWFLFFSLTWGLIFLKLYTMGAVVGIK